ncbi:hypothetical protein [Streptomyces camelliae]|uniref:Alpha/beta hydrolase n=1 Tax=Streptomyces camelliae TaxID=3004093 RepID=A0ABY7NUW4_9ACTN|nr:hypothetical protein [Streptomyces sp. HUAS 2-6]WBO61860.1 hypothetical protein O1G22_02885 [Streptomyces sp. HUAS 2-6]
MTDRRSGRLPAVLYSPGLGEPRTWGTTLAADLADRGCAVAAGIDMDGNLSHIDGWLMPVAQHGLDRPFLLLGKDGETDTGPGWRAFRDYAPG